MLNGDNFLNYSVNRNLNLDGYNNVASDLNDFGLFNNVGYDFLDFDSSWNFSILNYDPF